MYIKMEEDKSLIVTIPTSIYQGESNAGMLCFLLPQVQEEVRLADCAVLLKYVLPDGTGRSEALEFEPEPYKGYLMYKTLASTKMTEYAGVVKVWLTAINYTDAVVLKSGEISIDVLPSKNIANHLPPESLDQLDRLTIQVNTLQKTKADNLVFDEENKLLQLTAESKKIGDSVDLSSVVSGDDVIHFGSESGDDQPSDPNDEVIYF